MDMIKSYGLLKQTTDAQQVLKMSLAWLKDERAKEKHQANRQKFLTDKIDVTDFIVETIENAAGLGGGPVSSGKGLK